MIVYRLDTNRGKGAAVMRGFDLARAAGFTHALQIDADGQHDLSNLAEFIALGEAHPDALIAGAPDPRCDDAAGTTHRSLDHALLGWDRNAHEVIRSIRCAACVSIRSSE